MTARPLDFTKDYATLQAWWAKRGFADVARSLLPATGFIVDGVAAGFVYKTDSDICVFEMAIANPDATPADRQAALFAVSNAAIEWATNAGFKRMHCSTKNSSVLEKLRIRGFQMGEILQQTYFMLGSD